MMQVELGQGQERDRLELWFQRALKINPGDYGVYKAKEWYLLPRWYGTADDVFAFGQECIKTQNWSAKLPMILTVGMAESANGSPELYTNPEIGAVVEKTYRDYLDHYPDAIFYRSSFAKHAFDSDRKDIAREQLKILETDWDRNVISEEDFAKMNADLNPPAGH